MGKSILDFFLDDHMTFAQKRGIAGGKVVLPVGLGYEIQYREAVFLREKAKAAPQLLKENGHGVGRTKEEDCIHCRNIHPFIEKVHYENDGDISAFQLLPGRISNILRAVRIQGQGFDPLPVEVVCHKMGMFFRNAEAQGFHVSHIRCIPLQSLDNGTGPLAGQGSFPGIYIFQFFYIIMAAGPLDIGKAHGIVDAKVMEGAEKAPLNGIGKPDFCRHMTAEIVQYVLPIHSFRRSRKAQQDFRMKPGQ